MKHHYVPQFLLKPWAQDNDDKKIVVFRLDLNSLPTSRRTPKSTGYEENLYALTKPNIAGMEQQAIEKYFLKYIDNYASLVREKLLNGELNKLTARERNDWVIFIMSLRIRQPDNVKLLIHEGEKHINRSLESNPEQYEEIAGTDDPLTLKEWVQERIPGLAENFGLSIFSDLVSNSKIGNKILSMKWWIFNFSSDTQDLILADNPCIFTTGIDDPDLMIGLPISPKSFFLATRSSKVEHIIKSIKAKELVAGINESTISQAKVRIYARNTLPWRFIFNRLHKRKR